jgi:hypothetical protein
VTSSAEAFSGARVLATDGLIGRVADLLFDEEKWAVRYLVVSTGDWLPRRQVLVSPHSVRFVDTGSRLVVAGLTRDRVAGSPPIDTRSQITRQQEWEYCTYFGYSAYWPCGTYPPLRAAERAGPDVKLHSCRAFQGFLARGATEQLGRVDDLLFDQGTWLIRRIVIAAGRWLDGKRFDVGPERLHSVSWHERCLSLGVRRADIRGRFVWQRTASPGL